VLRLFGGGHILENNIVQTGASAGASISAGVIFTLPALVIIEYWKSFDYWWVLAIAGLGGVLGVLFSVPLRRALIVEQNLAFPEGKAAAEVLKAGENPGRGIKILAMSALIGGFAKILAQSGAKLLPDVAASAGSIGKAFAYVGTNLSPALLGVGYIVGLNISIVIVAGGVLSWDIAIPIYTQYFMDTVPAGDAEAVAYAVWGQQIRYLGAVRCSSAASGRSSRCARRCSRVCAAASRQRAPARPR
jgi:putative OPT family oligopeptide transporter